jgi:hypothetical protein
MTKPVGPRSARPPPVPDRVRRIDPGGFAFVPNRFLRDGFFAALTSEERSLYFLLLLAGDRNGVSYYHYDSLCSILEVPLDTYLAARNALIDKDLVAFDGTRFQVLSLPERPATKAVEPPRHPRADDPPREASIRQQILSALRDDDT